MTGSEMIIGFWQLARTRRSQHRRHEQPGEATVTGEELDARKVADHPQH